MEQTTLGVIFVNIFSGTSSQDLLLVFCFGSGEGLELQYTLHSFGIPVDLIPLTETGNIKVKNHQRFIKVRTMLERQSDSSELMADIAIECPRLHDVIFRVGDGYLCHPGNSMFRGWIESAFDDYDTADKDRKVEITWTLVDEVLKKGRFLVWNKHWWTVLQDREKMRIKVVGAFKDQKRRLKAFVNVQEDTRYDSDTYKFHESGRKRKREKESSCFGKSCMR